MERDGISAIKFEATRLHFLSDVLVAVAVVVAVVAFCAVGKLWRGKKGSPRGTMGRGNSLLPPIVPHVLPFCL